MQGWFTIKEINNVNHHISRIENHMISIDADKTIDKIQHSFMIKISIRVI